MLTISFIYTNIGGFCLCVCAMVMLKQQGPLMFSIKSHKASSYNIGNEKLTLKVVPHNQKSSKNVACYFELNEAIFIEMEWGIVCYEVQEMFLSCKCLGR